MIGVSITAVYRGAADNLSQARPIYHWCGGSGGSPLLPPPHSILQNLAGVTYDGVREQNYFPECMQKMQQSPLF